MDHVLTVFVLLWSSGLQTKEHNPLKDVRVTRLVGRRSRCSALLERDGRSTNNDNDIWDLKSAAVVCRQLDCGSVVQVLSKFQRTFQRTYASSCLQPKSNQRKCLTKRSHLPQNSLEITCSDSVRLLNGTSLCSGRLEVKSNQSWSSVCDDDFNLQEAEVVCRHLGCGAPLVFQGGLYGELKASVWSKEFQCEGNESALLDCDSSDSARNTCSPEPDTVRLVKGLSPCAGELEVKQQGQWRKVDDPTSEWNLKAADAMCRQMNCGSAVSLGKKWDSMYNLVWQIDSDCLQSESAVRECVFTNYISSQNILLINCSDSVRLLNGTSLCSGRLEVKSNQSWSSVCDDDFNLQEAEVVCRQLGCGAPLVFQGGLYGELKASVWSKEFQCEGNESALLDCDSSDSARNTCSPGKAVGLTCSELDNVRLSGGTSRCDGRVEMKREEWRPLVTDNLGDQDVASVVCRQLGCGSVVSAERTVSHSPGARWFLRRPCGQSDSNLRDCLLSKGVKGSFSHILQVICSDILVRPIISFAACNDGVSEANRTELQVLMGSRFTISCSIQPQFQGGSFQLILTTSAVSQNFTLPAVNHSARFLFSAAVHTHQGDYRCVYHVCVFNHNFSSASQQLSLTVSASLTDLIIRVSVVTVMLFSAALLFCFKATRGQKPKGEKPIELDFLGGAEERKEAQARE
ncbi:scavenger receptor cysteine-rich type 1 protein M130-like isoform X2 [Channa argus]|uniref:scavenger receptor cysteine-rich type 1 protein M130-like isoform X2 n=1 Tax=Channa argus TaxID=215402 RepID=UPI0035224E7D